MSGRSAKSFSFWHRGAPAASRLPAADGEARVIQIAPRIYAFAYDEDRDAWKDAVSHHKLSREYIAYLADAAAVLSKLRGSNGEKQQLMVANLGPSWGLPAVYKTFESSVLELDGWTAWERPPGIGSMPLDVVFSVCRTVFTWLHGSSSHIVALHARGCSAKQSGLQLVSLLAATYQLYAAQQETLWSAVHALSSRGGVLQPPPPSASAETAAIRALLGPAGCQYGRYVERILHAGTLPPLPPTALQLQRIVISAWEGHKQVPAPDGSGEMVQGEAVSMGRSVLAVFQRGQQIWSCAAAAQDDLIGFRMAVPLDGDITIALWFGDVVRDTDTPALAFAFHTGFAGPGVLRVEPRDMTVPKGSAFSAEKAAFDGFFMDVTLEDTHQKLERTKAGQQQADIRGMRAAWQDTLLSAGVPEGRLHINRKALAAQLDAVAAAGLTPSQLKAVPQASDSDAAAEHLNNAAGTPGGSEPASAVAATAVAAVADVEPAAARPPDSAPPDPPLKGRPPPPPPPPPPGGKAAAKPPATPPPPPPPGGKPAPRPPAPPPPLPPLGKGKPAPPPLPPNGIAKQGTAGQAGVDSAAAEAATAMEGKPQPASQPKFRILHWSKVPRRPGTVWEELPAPAPPLTADQADMLACLFSVQTRAPLRTTGASAAAAATPVHVITISRANNVAIMLTQFADWDGEAIRAAVHGASKLSPEKISLLLQIAPTDEEVSAMRAFDGTYEDLAPPERVLALLASVPRLRQKLQALLFQRQFGGLVADASVALRFAQAACTQVRGSARLRQVLRTILAAGNALNVGTSHAGALGFSVSTLQKLANLKVTLNSSAAASGGGAQPGEANSGPQLASAPTASATAAAAAAAIGTLPQVHNLLDFVAWLTSRECGSREQRPLSEELAAVEQAAARMQAGLAEALKDLDAGTDAVAAEHRQCQKSASCLPPPAGTAPTDGRPGLDSASTDGTTTAVNEPSQRAAAQVSDAAMTPAAQAVTAPEVPGPTRPRRLDLLTVSAEAPELVQHPLIAAEEAEFGKQLSDFLAAAKAQREALLDLSADTQLQVTVLLKWLGCTADADPAVEFSSLAQFARAFDKAFAAVAKR